MFLLNASYNYIMKTFTLEFSMEMKYLVTQVVEMLTKNQTVQNRSLKTFFNLKWDSNKNELHHNLKVLMVCDVFKICISEFVYKAIHNIFPNVVTNYYHTVNEIHQHGTRNAMKLHVKRAITCIGKKTAKIQGAEIFNRLPRDITNCTTVKSFRKSLKRHIIHSYIT